MNISEAIISFSKDIQHISIECAKNITTFYSSDSDKTVSNKDFGSIIVELEYLFLHVIDRYSYVILSESNRNSFIEALGMTVINSNLNNYGLNIDEHMIEEAKQYEINVLNERNQEYSKYIKLFPDQGEGTMNTLFWKFGKKISLEYLHTSNPAVIMKCVLVGSEIILKGKIEETLKNIISNSTN